MSITTIPFSARKAGPYLATAGQTEFSFGFPVFAAEDLTVWRERAGAVTQLLLTTHYTVTGIREQGGGQVVLTAGSLEDDIIAIDGTLTPERASSFVGGTPFKSRSIDSDLNRLAIIVQELARESNRAVRRAAVDENAGSLMLPQVTETTLLALNAAGELVGILTAPLGLATFPLPSTDKAIARFDGTGGSSLQDSGVIIDDNNNVLLPTGTAISWDSGDVSISHAADKLSIAFDGTTGVIFNKTQTELVNVFQESGETIFAAGHIFRASDPGSHSGIQHNLVHIESRPLGSGTNGPANSDNGLSISVVKQNFHLGLTAAAGEIDGLVIAIRQGGTIADACGILVNAVHTGTGFTGTLESTTSLTPPPTFAVTQSIRCQMGVINNGGSDSFGYYAGADTGTIVEAFRADAQPGATFTYLFRGLKSGGEVFSVNGAGVIHTYRNDTETSASQLSIEQDGTGDAVMDFLLTGTRIWQMGIDNSDGDAFKISPAQDSFASATFILDTAGNLITLPPASPPTLAVNRQVVMNFTSNTQLRFSGRGTDGTTRVVNLTLA